MIDERLYKVFGKKEYKELQKYKKTLAKTGLALIPPALLTTFNPLLSAILFSSSAVSLVSSKYISDKEIENYSKEVLQIKKLYEKTIRDYAKMNKMLNLNEPVEIHELFIYMLKNGYLSENKTFEKENIKSSLRTVLGAYVLLGKGVCRHISCIEKDIMEQSNIESTVLNLYQKPIQDSKREEILEQQVLEMLRKVYMPEKESKENTTSKIIINNYSDDYEMIKQSTEKNGNHAIVIAVKDGKLNLLDGMQERIYKKSKTNPMILVDDEKDNKICFGKTVFFGTKKDFNKQKKQIQLEETDKAEDERLIKQTKRLIEKNNDVFEHFYKDHEEIYTEVSSKIKKLERKKWN